MGLPKPLRGRCYRYARAWKCPGAPDLRRTVQQRRWPKWLLDLKSESGVYLIRDRTSKDLLYVGRGRTDLKKSIVRHFHQWQDMSRTQHRYVLFDRYEVEVRYFCVACEHVAAAEADLIALYGPRLNARAERSSRTVEVEACEEAQSLDIAEDLEDAPF